MARYIDADELYKATQKRIAEANEARMAVVDDEFLDLINDAFTEDVAPREEVAREIFWEMDKLLLSITIDEEAEESFVGFDFDKYIALKKKYTQSEPPKGG